MSKELKWLHEHKGGYYDDISQENGKGDAERAARIAEFHLVGRHLEEERGLRSVRLRKQQRRREW